MNCCVRATSNHIFLAAGQEGHTQLYNVKTRVQGAQNDEQDKGGGGTVRRRRTSETNGTITGDKEKLSKRLTFSIVLSDSVKTDFR